MAQLLRDNAADTRVTDDVAALAAAYDEVAVAAAAETARQRREEDLALLATLFAKSDAPAAPLWPRVRTHVVRYRTYYVGIALVLGVVLFRSAEPLPVTDAFDDATILIPTLDDQANASTVADLPEAFVPFADQFALAEPEFVPPATFSDPGETAVSPPVTSAPAPVLRVSQSGYASKLGGTPADQQPPGNGLPVEAVVGRVTKYSYMRLTGGGRVLRLKALTDDGASLNPEQTRVQLCEITTPRWQPNRATPTADAPAYNDGCVEGTNNNGVWSFTFSSLYDPLRSNGWAVVPVVEENVTFRVTFSPSAV